MVEKNKKKAIPAYLKKDWAESRWQRVARYRLTNGIKRGKYWEEEEKRVCRLCKVKEETWKHV